MKKRLSFFLGLVWMTTGLEAQNFDRFKSYAPWSFSLQMGPTQYFGDLYDLWKYREGIQPDYNFTIGSRYTVSQHLKVRADLSFYQISGTDKKADPRSFRHLRDLNFRARNGEGTLLIEGYLFPVDRYNIYRERYNPYIFIGIGGTTNNPHANYRNKWVPLRPLRTENRDYSPVALVFPMGIGFKYKTNVWMDFFIEGNYRFTLTDYLDDVSVYDITDFYRELIEDYGTNGNGPNPDRLRLSVRQGSYLNEDGEPNVSLIESSGGSPRRGSGDPTLKDSGGRYDGYFTLNIGLEIHLSDDIFDYWIFRKKRGRSRFW